MRKIPTQQLESYRKQHPLFGQSPRGQLFGYFSTKINGTELHFISSGEAHFDMSWEHVSVSTEKRCPTWEEMSFVKDLFWLPTELVVQFHPPKAKHINVHPFCLHLWRDVKQDIKLPPDWTIA